MRGDRRCNPAISQAGKSPQQSGPFVSRSDTCICAAGGLASAGHSPPLDGGERPEQGADERRREQDGYVTIELSQCG